MAWELSISNEGIDLMREEIFNLPHNKLVEIIQCGNDNQEIQNHDYIHCRFNSSDDNLAEALFERAFNKIRTTDNGAHKIWLCFDGCPAHKILLPD